MKLFKARGRVYIGGEGVERVERGELNIYLKWLRKVENAKPGDYVEVRDEGGRHLGYGFYESIGAIAVRILCYERSEDPVRDKLREALIRRRNLNLGNFYRLVHSEADGLPGLIVDVYNDICVVSSTSLGFDRALDHVGSLLHEMLGVRVYVRNDSRPRREVGLKTWRGWLKGRGRTWTIIEEAGVKFKVDVEKGQKTGFFIDQRMNRILLESLTSPGARVLDLYSYTGGFSLHALKAGASHATLVDESEIALKLASESAILNHVEERILTCNMRVKEFLERTIKRGEEYDIVILDPPALAPSRDRVRDAVKTYFAANRAALKVVARGGIVFTFSCSRFIPVRTFRNIVLDAARKAGRKIWFLGGVYGQSPDHPEDPLHPWTSYLKGLLLLIQ